MADACIVMYNAVNAESLITAQDNLRTINKDNEIRRRPILLISNVNPENESEREVLASTGIQIAQKIEYCEFIELDVRLGDILGAGLCFG